MPSQDARDTALSEAPVAILIRRRSSLDRSPLLRRFCQTPGLRLRRSPRRAPLQLLGLNVLVHTEEIIRIVFLFERDEPLVIGAVRFFHTFFAFVAHQEVYVSAASRIWVNRIVIALRPGNNFVLVCR